MIERKELLSFNYYKKEPFTGSYRGMRYRIEKAGDGDVPYLLAATYPQPFCFDATDDEKKTFGKFEFSEEGLCAVVDWLNEQYAKGYQKKETGTDMDCGH